MKPVVAFAVFVLCCGRAVAAVDVNTASAEELQGVRGIGPATAAKILAARESGPFRDADDLQDRVRGFGPKTVRRLTGAGLSVPSVSIRAPAYGGPEVIVGRPVVRAAIPSPACPAVRGSAAADAAVRPAARPRKPKTPGTR